MYIYKVPTGLPDCLFSHQKGQFWYILEGCGTDIFGVLLGHFVRYCNNGVHISWPFGFFVAILVDFFVLVWCTKKNMATLGERTSFSTV
jgi:hypothetical protein